MKNFVVMCAVAAVLAFTASDAHAKKCCAKTKNKCGNSCGQVSTCCAQTAPAPCQVASCNTGCNTGCQAQTASCCKQKTKACCNAQPACAVTACCATTGTTPVIAKPYEEVKAPEAPAPAPAPTPAK